MFQQGQEAGQNRIPQPDIAGSNLPGGIRIKRWHPDKPVRSAASSVLRRFGKADPTIRIIVDFRGTTRAVDPVVNDSKLWAHEPCSGPILSRTACGSHDYLYDLIRAGVFGDPGGDEAREARRWADKRLAGDVFYECNALWWPLCGVKSGFTYVGVRAGGSMLTGATIEDVDVEPLAPIEYWHDDAPSIVPTHYAPGSMECGPPFYGVMCGP